MGVGKDMKTFFAAMNEQVGMGGYGGKIKSTPMGPFRWNDTIQLWENVNNGMTMNNVAFHDMFMMDYESNSGDSAVPSNFNPTLTPSDWGTLEGMDQSGEYWARTGGATITQIIANAVTFTNLSGPITITLTITGNIGTPLTNIRYKLDGAAIATYSTPLTISNNSVLYVGCTTPIGVSILGIGNIVVTNTTTSTILDTIPYSFSIE